MTDERLKGRIAIITGGSSGIGMATAFKFANSGARIIIADLRSSGVEEKIKQQHGEAAATFVSCNVTKETEIGTMVEKAVQWGGAGRLDILCNFAGIAAEAELPSLPRCHTLDTEIFDRTIAVNSRGTWLCCKYALKQMMDQEPREANARGERTRGWIVNRADDNILV
jgi:NAD(P)-dependent dehydrogenase (short-subunit alcohol dehydrogenase family)